MENSRIVIFEKYYVFLIFLILLDSIFGDTAVQRIYGELNGNITLRPGVTGTIKEILWKHNGDKAAEFTRPDPVQSYRDFQHRVILNITTGHLTITKLNYKDNGQYMAESQLDEKQQLQYYTVNLTVIEPITLPIVQCTKNETAAKLLCSAKGPNLQYSWKGGSISTPTWSPEPTELVIIKEDDPDSIYTCLVKSEASNRSSEAYKVAECTVGSSLIYSIMTVVIILVAVVVIAGGFLLYRLRRQGTNYHEVQQNPGTNYHEVQQNPDIESNRNTNDQDPSSSGNYPPNAGRETEERTNAGTGARKALPGSKMNEMVLTDREKQMHETERAANQEGKGNVKYESPSEVKDDKKPNKTDEEKEDLLQKGTTEGDVKQEEKKMDAIVLNKDKNGVKKTDSQEEGKDQREEENIEPQDDEAQKVEEKKTDPQKENKDHKEEKTDSQKENKDCKEEKPDPQKENKDRKEEKTDPQKENKDCKEEKPDPQKENKDRKEEKTDPQKENKDRKEEKTDPQKENKDCKEEKPDPQAKDKDQKEEEKKNDPQEEDKAQKEEEKKPDPQNENKDCKEEKTDSQAKDKDQKGEEKQGEENRNS